MKNLLPVEDRIVALGAAIAAPVDALLIHEDVWSSTTGTLVGAIVAAAVAAWHASAVVKGSTSKTEVTKV